MIRVEHPYKDNENLIKTDSDSGVMIRQIETGLVYSEAVDKFPCSYTYEETDVKKSDAE